jgi:hypothetical protein
MVGRAAPSAAGACASGGDRLCHEARHAYQIVCGRDQVTGQLGAHQPAVAGATKPPTVFSHPNTSSNALARGVPRMPSGAAIDSATTIASVLRHMRCDLLLTDGRPRMGVWHAPYRLRASRGRNPRSRASYSSYSTTSCSECRSSGSVGGRLAAHGGSPSARGPYRPACTRSRVPPWPGVLLGRSCSGVSRRAFLTTEVDRGVTRIVSRRLTEGGLSLAVKLLRLAGR